MSQLSLIGQMAGNYEIRSLLGRGGMASVFLAEHPRIGRQVAVKVLAPHLTLQPQMPERFERDARAAARLVHPNIIEIIDFGNLEDGSPYYTMELLRGRELRPVGKEKGRWSAWEAQPYLAQICAALQVAHEAKMVHRDLKPENIFVLDGEPMRLKILDFGLAKLLEGDDALQTATGTLLGSPTFTAPEQAAGRPDAISPRTDVYSLGVILYWMLCGRPPFEARTAGMLVHQQIEDPPPPLRSKNPAVPPAVADLVHACLEKEPSRRPASARAVQQTFDRVLKAQDRDAMEALEQELEAESPPGDGLPDEGLSSSLAAFLGVDDEPPAEEKEPILADASEGRSPALEPRIPAPAPVGGQPEPKPPEPPAEEKVPAPVLPPREPSAAPSATPASLLDLPAPMEAAELASAAREVSEPEDAPSAPEDEAFQDTILDNPLLGGAPKIERPEQEVEVEADEAFTTDVLGLMVDDAERSQVLGVDGEDEVDEDLRPTETALPLLGHPSNPPPADEGAPSDDDAFSTSVLGLIGDPTERNQVLGLADEKEEEEVDEAATTTVVTLLGDKEPR